MEDGGRRHLTDDGKSYHTLVECATGHDIGGFFHLWAISFQGPGPDEAEAASPREEIRRAAP
jgi:hypothetical protein